jgi:hypothetical protein
MEKRTASIARKLFPRNANHSFLFRLHLQVSVPNALELPRITHRKSEFESFRNYLPFFLKSRGSFFLDDVGLIPEIMSLPIRRVSRVRSIFLGVPSEGWRILTGERPVMVEAGSHVAWMAGGDGNVAF